MTSRCFVLTRRLAGDHSLAKNHLHMHYLKLTLSLIGTALFAAGAHPLAAQPQTASVTLVSTFDYPRLDYTLVNTAQINDAGTFVLQLLQGSAVVGGTGNIGGQFFRPFVDPNEDAPFTSPTGINNLGEICGRFDRGGRTHGFIRRGQKFKTYDAPVAALTSTTIEGINDAGDICGLYTASSGSVVGAYARIGGTFIALPISGTLPDATDINNLNEVVGNYGDPGSGNTFHGFFRAADGTLTLPIDVAGAIQTVPLAINDAGYFVGFWTDRHGAHAFVMHLPDTVISYDMPGAAGTAFTGINNDGVIVGNYQDAQHVTHGLVAQLQVE